LNPQDEAIALWRYFEGRGIKPTVRMVSRILRDELGLGRRESDVRKWLAGFLESSRDASRTQETSVRDADGMRPHARAVKVLVPKLGLFSIENSDVPKPKPKKPPAEWTVPLLADTAALNERELRSLSPAELHTLARAHALLFGNCTVTEKTNKARASPVATGLKYLLETLKRAQWAKWADLSVREYLDAGRNVTKRRGGVPWFQPSLILPELPDGAAYAKTSTQPGHDSTPERGAFGQPPRAYPEVSGLERHPLGCGPDDRSRERRPPALAG
jgi:hypothetical protein